MTKIPLLVYTRTLVRVLSSGGRSCSVERPRKGGRSSGRLNPRSDNYSGHMSSGSLLKNPHICPRKAQHVDPAHRCGPEKQQKPQRQVYREKSSPSPKKAIFLFFFPTQLKRGEEERGEGSIWVLLWHLMIASAEKGGIELCIGRETEALKQAGLSFKHITETIPISKNSPKWEKLAKGH